MLYWFPLEPCCSETKPWKGRKLDYTPLIYSSTVFIYCIYLELAKETAKTKENNNRLKDASMGWKYGRKVKCLDGREIRRNIVVLIRCHAFWRKTLFVLVFRTQHLLEGVYIKIHLYFFHKLILIKIHLYFFHKLTLLKMFSFPNWSLILQSCFYCNVGLSQSRKHNYFVYIFLQDW